MSFYIGDEFHLTPAYKQRTLFVEGLFTHKEVLTNALNEQCPHIHLGYNDSFVPKNSKEWKKWEGCVMPMLKDNIWVTLSFDNKYSEEFLESGMTEYDTFIPLIKIDLPFLKQYNYNATLAITDKQKMVNPGIWYHGLHELMARDSFLHNTNYRKPLKMVDKYIKDK